MAALVGMALTLGGCDLHAPDGSASTSGVDSPKVHLVGAWVSTSYDSSGTPVRTQLGEGTVTNAVALTSSIVLTFDRFLLPQNVIRQAICVRPSLDVVGELADCRGPSPPFLEPTYSPARRQVTFFLPAGERWLADTVYRLTLLVATEESDFGFRAFDGSALGRAVQLDFRTAVDEVYSVEEPPPEPERYCAAVDCAAECRSSADTLDDPEAQQACIAERCDCLDTACLNDGDLTASLGGLFSASCAFPGCHGGEAAAMGLDLSAPEHLRATAIGKVAHQTQTGEQANVGEISPQRFGRAMPLIAPSNPGNSYLIYKLAAHPLNHPSPPSPQSDSLLDAIARLRASVVVGQPMPPDGALVGSADDPTGERAWERLLLFEDWISHGAVTRCP